jgi:hypothetical protein
LDFVDYSEAEGSAFQKSDVVRGSSLRLSTDVKWTDMIGKSHWKGVWVLGIRKLYLVSRAVH